MGNSTSWDCLSQVGRLFNDMIGAKDFLPPVSKQHEEKTLLNGDDPHPAGLLTENEIQRLLQEEYGEQENN